MKNLFKGMPFRCIRLFLALAFLGWLLPSCDIYSLDDKEPDWLGASVYDYLKTDGHFNNFTRLVDDLNYKEVLSKTGSKTLFVANDSAFVEFYKNNSWGVKNYDQLTVSQKKLIMNFSMLNNSYLTGMLANSYNGGLSGSAGSLSEGTAFRRVTAVNALDSLPFDIGDKIPNSTNWGYYKSRGIYLLKDNTPLTSVIFTRKFLKQAFISDEDFRIVTGRTRTENDVFMFDSKVIKADITCKNGYLNIIDRVMVPPVNMAQYIFNNKNLSVFSSILERFSAPYYDPASTIYYRQFHPEFSDSIFVKKYFSSYGGRIQYPNRDLINSGFLLAFDPGWNSYANGAVESDMAGMFVPTDETMNNYFNNGEGLLLKNLFGTWDNIPLEILAPFMNRHMRTSFLESVPSKFPTMVDKENSLLNVSKDDVAKPFVASNGLVYETKKVYPPDDYISVYGPVLLSANDKVPGEKTKIWNWAITSNDFRLYLNAMEKDTKYSFFVPTDDFFKNYIDPVAIAKDVSCALKYHYDPKNNSVFATVYSYNKSTGEIGTDSIGVVKSNTGLIRNRLLDMLNSHIVVGNVESGNQYYITKGNVALKIDGGGIGMKVQAGGNIQMNEQVAVTRAYQQTNGNTYFIDRPIQSPLKSVYRVLSETPEFSAFFSLVSGFPADSKSAIFANKKNYYGTDFVVKFFNTFNYTVYVPTNDAINKAINDSVISPWETQGSIIGINQMTDASQQAAAISKLENFLRYHFQDNSVFVDNKDAYNLYQSSTMKQNDYVTHFDTFKNKYYKIGVKSSPGKILLTTETNRNVNVVTSNKLYNIMTRDFIFSDKPSAFKEADGTGGGTPFESSQIYTSSTAVIQQIDGILDFQ